MLRTRREIDIDKAKRELLICFENNGKVERGTNELTVVMAAYVICKIVSGETAYNAKMSDRELIESMNGISDSLRNTLLEVFEKDSDSAMTDKNVVPILLQIANHYNKEIFTDIVINVNDIGSFGRPTGNTPDTIVKLALRILDLKPGDKVADICCGRGDFMTTASLETPRASYTGLEINYRNLAIAEARSDVLNHVFSLYMGSPFSWYNTTPTGQFNKIFSLHPFGSRKHLSSEAEKVVEGLNEKISDGVQFASTDWLYTEVLMNMLGEEGKAVTFVSDSCTWSMRDRGVREYYVENGLIEAVISLPDRILNGSPAKLTMLILSRGNKGIRFVDASNCYISGRGYLGGRSASFSEENISEIIDALISDTNRSVFVDSNTVKGRGYILSAEKYLTKEYDLEGGIPFGDVIKHVTRGISLSASELDAITSEKPTKNQYLRISDIENDIISEDLPFIEDIDKKLERYCLNDGDLIITKIGFPQKICVAQVKPGQTILATGNLYIVTLDREKVNPYYLKAFFKSNKGQEALKSITSGAALPSVPVKQLKELLIPVLDMETQEKIAEEVMASEDQLRIYALRTRKVSEKITELFEEVIRG